MNSFFLLFYVYEQRQENMTPEWRRTGTQIPTPINFRNG